MRFDVNWYTLSHTRVLHDCMRTFAQHLLWFDYLAMNSYDRGRHDQINWLPRETSSLLTPPFLANPFLLPTMPSRHPPFLANVTFLANSPSRPQLFLSTSYIAF